VKVALEKLGSETGSVEISSGNSDQRLDAQSPGPRVLSWSPQGNPEAFVMLYPATSPPAPPAAASKPPPASGSSGTAASNSAAPALPASPQPVSPPPQPVRIGADGPWALFRLVDKAEKQNAGPQSIRATFRSGAYWATLIFQLPTIQNPFGRGGMWSFRCPATL
jgi:type VI secretion system protein ImpL